MRVLGIDPGLRSTGWGVISISRGRLQHIANGAIRPNPHHSDANRLIMIYKGLSSVIADKQPDRAAIEDIFVAKSARSALRLGMARGVGVLACCLAHLDVIEIAARAVKKAVVGTGTASKEQIQDMVARLLQVRVLNEDAADALAIAIAVSNDAGKPSGITLKSAQSVFDDPLAKAISLALARDNTEHKGKT